MRRVWLGSTLLLCACADPAPAWTTPLEPAPTKERFDWEPERLEVLRRHGPPTDMVLVDGELVWSDGGALYGGGVVVDTPGWVHDLEATDDGVLVASGLGGLLRWVPGELEWTELVPGNALSVGPTRVLLGEGWMVEHGTGDRLALDGDTLRSVQESGVEWAVSAMDGGLFLGRGMQRTGEHRVRARRAVPHEGSWLVWTQADTLVTLDGEQRASAVTGLVATRPPTWADGGGLRTPVGGAPVYARPGATLEGLAAADQGVLVAWSDGRIEHVVAGDSVEVGRFTPVAANAFLDLIPEPVGVGPSPFGLLFHDSGVSVPLPDGRPADRVIRGQGWSVGLHRNSGALVAVHEDGRVVRRLLPGMANQAVLLEGGYLVVALGGRGVAGLSLEGPEAPIQVLDIGDQRWAGVCSDGERALLAWGEHGVLLLAQREGRLVVEGRTDTPGKAHSCRWKAGHWEVHDGTSRLRVRL